MSWASDSFNFGREFAFHPNPFKCGFYNDGDYFRLIDSAHNTFPKRVENDYPTIRAFFFEPMNVLEDAGVGTAAKIRRLYLPAVLEM